MPEDDLTTTHDEHYTYVLRRCDAFADERKTLLATLLSVTERFDKWLIGLPAGAAGLSLVFYEKVASKAEAIDLRILAWAWGLMSAGIAFGFLSLFLSTLAVGRQVVILDEEHADFLKHSTPEKPQGKKRRKPLTNRWTPWTSAANGLSAISSIVGIALFLHFTYSVATTLTETQNNERQRQTTQEGGIRSTEERQSTTAAKEGSQGGLRPPAEPAAPSSQKVDDEQAGASDGDQPPN